MASTLYWLSRFWTLIFWVISTVFRLLWDGSALLLPPLYTHTSSPFTFALLASVLILGVYRREMNTLINTTTGFTLKVWAWLATLPWRLALMALLLTILGLYTWPSLVNAWPALVRFVVRRFPQQNGDRCRERGVAPVR